MQQLAASCDRLGMDNALWHYLGCIKSTAVTAQKGQMHVGQGTYELKVLYSLISHAHKTHINHIWCREV